MSDRQRYYCTNKDSAKPCAMLNRDVFTSTCESCGKPTTEAHPMPEGWFEKMQEAAHR